MISDCFVWAGLSDSDDGDCNGGLMLYGDAIFELSIDTLLFLFTDCPTVPQPNISPFWSGMVVNLPLLPRRPLLLPVNGCCCACYATIF